MNQGPNGKATGGQSSGAPQPEFPLEYALQKKGVDAAFISERLIDMVDAKRKQWSPATKSWKTFEDYKTRLAALEQIAMLLGLYPTQKELEGRHKPHETIITVMHETSEPKHRL
jgi:hypothetical protein